MNTNRIGKIIINQFALWAILLPISTFSQTIRKYSNDFLNIGVGARAMGMSNAVVASTGDVHAGYWNPAGLTNLQNLETTPKFQTSLMHSAYFAGMANYDYGSVAIPIEEGVIAFSLIRFGVDDIQNTINLVDPNTGAFDYSRISKFSTADYAGIISFARKTPIEGLSLGANVKIIHRIIGDFANAWGFGLDAGAQYQHKNLKLGAVLRDATSTFNAWSYSLDNNTKDVFIATGNEVPENNIEVTLPRLIIGGGYKFYFLKNQVSAMPELDAEVTFDGERSTVISSDPVSVDPRLGLELSYKELIYLRGGIGNIQEMKAEVGNYNETTFQPNFGIGLQLKDLFGLGTLSIDYALTDIGDQTLLYSNVFSLRLDLNN